MGQYKQQLLRITSTNYNSQKYYLLVVKENSVLWILILISNLWEMTNYFQEEWMIRNILSISIRVNTSF